MMFCIASAQAQQARFDDATTLLEEQEYRQALTLYKTIAEEGFQSGALWLNMGIAYTHLDSLGMAKYYFLKAERFSETRPQAEEALLYINERFPRRSAVLPPLPWDRFFDMLSRQFGTTGLFYGGFFFLWLGVAFWVGSWFRPAARKILKTPGLTAIGLSALIFMSALYIHYLENRFGTGVMINRQSTVYAEPGPEASVVSTAYEGYTMRVDHRRSADHPDWNYVRLENGMYGWVAKDALEIY